MYGESSDEEDGFILSSPSDNLVYESTSQSISQSSNVNLRADKSQSEVYNQPFSHIPPVALGRGRGRGAVRPPPHPLMERYTVISESPISSGIRLNVPQGYSGNQPRWPNKTSGPSGQQIVPAKHKSVPTKSHQTTSTESQLLQTQFQQEYRDEFPSLSSSKETKQRKKRKANKQVVDQCTGIKSSGKHDLKSSNPDVSETWLRNLQFKSGSDPDREEMKCMLQAVEGVWYDENQTDKSGVSKMIKDYYSQATHPYILILYFIEQCRDHNSGKTTSLCYSFMKEFLTWSKKSQLKNKDELLTQDIKLHALQACTRYNTAMFNMAVPSFELNHPGNEYMLPQIKSFLDKKKYNEVCLKHNLLLLFIYSCVLHI